MSVLQARYENAYVHVMNVLKYLIDPSAGNASTLPRESSLSDAERKDFLETLLQVPSLPFCMAFVGSCSSEKPSFVTKDFAQTLGKGGVMLCQTRAACMMHSQIV